MEKIISVIFLIFILLFAGCAQQNPTQVNFQMRNLLQGRRVAVCSDNYRQDVVSVVEHAVRQMYGAMIISSRECNANRNPIEAEFILKVETNSSGGPLGYMLTNQRQCQRALIKVVDAGNVVVAMGYAESSDVRVSVAISSHSRRNRAMASYHPNDDLSDVVRMAVLNLQ